MLKARPRGCFEDRFHDADLRPPTVLVVKGDLEVVIRLGDAQHPPVSWERRGVADGHAIKALHIVKARQDEFLRTWRRLHD
ncbi:MAG: hypothetical protein VKS61_13370 [Candidatus Sericytochromatia bacterium]|nr:hypothetical protein [Candidatus Sericytochromatia bacterium]